MRNFYSSFSEIPPFFLARNWQRNFIRLPMVLIVLFGIGLTEMKGEGTRQLAPNSDGIVMLETGRDDFGDFADFDGPAESRLLFRIKTAGERVYLGLSQEYTNQGNPMVNALDLQYKFRIKRINESGADPIVHGPFTITQDNFNVSGWSDAVFGAYDTTATKNGEFIFVFIPSQAGDYYIEFDDESTDGDPKVNIGFWDITLTNDQLDPIEGRLWSKNWALRTPPKKGSQFPDCAWDRKFNGTFYSYTNDGFVSKIDLDDSGFQGLSFNVAFNMTGPGTSGNFAEDRKSIEGVNATDNAAMHKIFLSEPDITLFPSGDCGEIITNDFINCEDGSFCFEVTVTRAGQVDIFLDFNRNGVFDPNSQDVNLVYCFMDEERSACIPWNGLKGDGSSISFADTLNIIYSYTQGIQHWAMYDVEFIKNGFCVETVRPICGTDIASNKLFWDDRNISDLPGTGQPRDGRNGCICRTDNCRTWNFFDPNTTCESLNDDITEGYGDKNTLNTWWFASSTRKVSENVAITTCQLSGINEICPGESTEFTASVSTESDPENLTYEWSGPNGFSRFEGPGSGPISTPGTYCLTVTDAQGCETTCCRELTLSPSLELMCQAEDVSCFGAADACISTVAMGGVGEIEYRINEGPFQMSSTFDGLGPGRYTITARDKVTGCIEECTVEIGEPDPINLNLSQESPVSCFGEATGTAVVVASGGTGEFSYLWDNGETTATAENLEAGTHTVTVTDTDGCTAEGEIFISQLSNTPVNCVATQDSPVTCFGGENGVATATPDGGVPPYSFMWDNGETTQTATSLEAGEHFVTVTDSEGCASQCSVTITQPEELLCVANLESNVRCNGESNGSATAVATGGVGEYSYLWDNGETTATAVGLDAGTHSVTVTDENGCTTVCSVTVSEPPPLTCSTQVEAPVSCFNEANGEATITVVGGNGGYIFTWDNGEKTPTALNLDAGEHSVTVVDSEGCSIVCTVFVPQPELLTCSITLDSPVRCFGESNGQATVTASGGNGGYTYNWDNGEKTATAVNLDAGEHSVTVTDSEGCSAICTITVTQPDELTCAAVLVSDVSCNGGSDGSAQAIPTGGNGGYTYEWDNGETTQTAINLTAGIHTVTVTDERGCTTTCTVEVGEPEALTCAVVLVSAVSCN
ncbi:MAG: hypothetical protein R3350_04375, partial [Saprospiraceae bacterium]|nr:hypothetical protein [Saprospiraceae bacterium]